MTIVRVQIDADRKPYVLDLPWPPTINSYYVHHKRGAYISERGTKFRIDVEAIVLKQGRPNPAFSQNIFCYIEYVPPFGNYYDADNYQKGLFDALTNCGVWRDDSNVVSFLPVKCPFIGRKNAGCRIAIWDGLEGVYVK